MRPTARALCAVFLTAALAATLAAPAGAADATLGGLTIQDPWARATVGAGAGAAFLAVMNESGTDDRLVGASADVSRSTELHTHVRDGEVMRMRQVDAIDVPAGQTTMLEPGGLHVMFLGLKAPLKSGETFPLTLSFAEAGEVTVEVQVKDMATMSPTSTGDHGSGHGSMDKTHK